jgi:hypothetical protein
MTTIAPRRTTRAELAQASGLREDLIERFIPTVDTPTGPMYLAQQLHLVLYVKELIACDLPPSAVDDKVREYLTRPAPTGVPPIIPKPAARRRGPSAAIGGTAAAALLLGGVIGGIIGSSNKDSAPAAAAPTVTVEAAAPQVNPTIPAVPDPVCAEWAAIGDRGRAERAAWRAADANVPATQWSPAQRQLNMQLVGQLRGEAAALRRLAAQAEQPLLATVLATGAAYEEAFAGRIPEYTPADLALWTAATDAANLTSSLCQAVTPR